MVICDLSIATWLYNAILYDIYNAQFQDEVYAKDCWLQAYLKGEG